MKNSSIKAKMLQLTKGVPAGILLNYDRKGGIQNAENY